jgi:hypothetical protein
MIGEVVMAALPVFGGGAALAAMTTKTPAPAAGIRCPAEAAEHGGRGRSRCSR